jgi:hypothetical protein
MVFKKTIKEMKFKQGLHKISDDGGKMVNGYQSKNYGIHKSYHGNYYVITDLQTDLSLKTCKLLRDAKKEVAQYERNRNPKNNSSDRSGSI